jgi:hypothetical protein
MVSNRAIAEGNWKRPLDFSLHGTFYGELFSPFSSYVRQTVRSESTETFGQYAKLPTELQLRILQSCDAATLFRLMHTSRSMRIEAKKLFFSNRRVWYLVHADWLLKGGHPAYTKLDLDMLACVEQLNLDFSSMRERTWMTPQGSGTWIGTEDEAVATGYGGMDEQIRIFWGTVQRRLPQLKHIVLSDEATRTERRPPALWKKVGQMCPASIDVSFYFLHGDDPYNGRCKRTWWRRVINQTATHDANARYDWEPCSELPDLVVIPPYHRFRGPVGSFERYCAKYADYNARWRATRKQRIATMERLHFHQTHQPFGCSAPDCTAWFTQPEEYTTHAIETRHDEQDTLPEVYESVFAENDEKLKQLRKDIKDLERPFLEWWDVEGSEKREVAQREFVHQLEHDPLYAQEEPVEKHPLLSYIHRSLDDDDC